LFFREKKRQEFDKKEIKWSERFTNRLPVADNVDDGNGIILSDGGGKNMGV
jgi:hypothetical protein